MMKVIHNFIVLYFQSDIFRSIAKRLKLVIPKKFSLTLSLQKSISAGPGNELQKKEHWQIQIVVNIDTTYFKE